MGKKNKNKNKVKGQQPSKLLKTALPNTPSSPPSPRAINIDYDDMPPNHKKKFFIHDECGIMYKYTAVIAWLRCMGCLDGTIFDDIGNLNWSQGRRHGYPLLEMEVITPNDNSARFLISKNELYVIAFFSQHKWLHFNKTGYNVTGGEGFKKLGDFTGSYTTKAWKFVGPNEMIKAVNLIATQRHNGDMSPFVQACEVFFVHLSEAARFYPVESVVCKTLAPPAVSADFEKRTYEDEENIILEFDDNEKNETKIDPDVYSLVKANGPINFNISEKTPIFIESLIKNFAKLSKVWYLYSFTRFCNMSSKDAVRFHIRSVKSLRCTLAVLCNVNLNKLLDDWVDKAKTHEKVNRKVYREMEQQILRLQEEGKVRVPKENDLDE